ncbi:MAG: DUF4276 family protein [Magnetococcales bacterium]|nr:DUF4276 family protein [Magnetococcales bacterium]
MNLVFFLEEASAKVFLQELMPRILPLQGVALHFIVFEGKQDLEKQLYRKLRHWQNPDSRFVVLRDRDAGDCRVIKERLWKLADEGNHPETLIRIACRELESWFLGDLKSIETAFNVRGVATQQRSRKFRDPDGLDNPVQELTRMAPTYQKISGARAMGRIMNRENNTSRSFNVFIEGIDRLIQAGSTIWQ